MKASEAIIEEIRQAFKENIYPGDPFLQGSSEGCEPFEEVDPFTGKNDWRGIESEFLDTQAGALNFFSEAGLRFFLPAYLIADLQGQLRFADALFHCSI